MRRTRRVSIEIEHHEISISLTINEALGFSMPIDVTSWLNIEPRFAALAYQSKQTLSTSDATLRHDSTGAGFDAGLAFSVPAGGPIYLGAGIDCFHEDRGCNTLLVSAQIEYRFGHRAER